MYAIERGAEESETALKFFRGIFGGDYFKDYVRIHSAFTCICATSLELIRLATYLWRS